VGTDGHGRWSGGYSARITRQLMLSRFNSAQTPAAAACASKPAYRAR
jgi:hypothetical protein